MVEIIYCKILLTELMNIKEKGNKFRTDAQNYEKNSHVKTGKKTPSQRKH